MRVRWGRAAALLATTSLLAFAWRVLLQERWVARDDATASSYRPAHRPPHTVTVCAVCCGVERLAETLTMVKSAVALSGVPLRVILLADDVVRPALEEKLNEWRTLVGSNRLRYELRGLQFPERGATASEWRRLFKPCAAQRLFLPDVLNDVDALLYVDTDVLFADGPERAWSAFGRMNSSQLAALAPEHHDPNVGWYNRFARHPFYPPLGLNSGVMLMNLTRMREWGWTRLVGPVYARYRLRITWGDQDIINIVFAGEPSRLLVWGCEHNLRPDHCMYGGGCSGAESGGAAVVHGSRGYFHRPERQPVFAALYGAWEAATLAAPLDTELLLPLEAALAPLVNATCARIIPALLAPLRRRASQPQPPDSTFVHFT